MSWEFPCHFFKMDAASLSWASLLKGQGAEAVIAILQQASESIHRVNPDGTTLLHLFAMMGSARLVRYLWDHGARPTVVSVDSSTLLHSAVRAKDESEDRERAEILECFLRGERDRESESAGGEEAFVPIDVDHRSDRGWTALKQAARKKLERCVEVLLRFDADPDLADDEQYTALHNAADCSAIMKLLAVKSRNLNAANEKGETALYVACDRGTTAAALILLEHKADPNVPDTEGITPLFLAARNGNVELVKALVRAKADVNKLGGSQCIGPLHWAAHKEYSEVALFLIEHGGDLLLKDGEGRTPLSMASLVLAEKMIDVAKQHKRDFTTNLQPDREAMSAKEKALGACCSGNLQALQALLESSDITVNMTCGKTGATLLHMAAYCGQANVAVFLLHVGANIQLKDMEQDSVLHFACMKSVPHGTHEAILELLLETTEAKGMIDVRNAKGDTPLMLAARCGFPSRARLLLKYGADPLISNLRNELPFHRACTSMENLELVLRLAEVMPDINVQDADGWTPLMFACKAQCNITIQYLLQRGADPNIPQSAGFTALYLAAQENSPTICELLLEKGAECNVQGGLQQLTPLHLAAHAGYMAVSCVLAEHGANPHLKDSDGDSPLQLCSAELKSAILVGHERWVAKQQEQSTSDRSAQPSEGKPPSSVQSGECVDGGKPPLERQVTNSKMAELEVEDEPNNEVPEVPAATVLESLEHQVENLQLCVADLEGERAALKAELAVLKDTAPHTSAPWPVLTVEGEGLVLEEAQVQLQPPLYEDQWCAVSLGSYGCMEVTVTEARGGKREGDPKLQQGLAILSRLRCPYLALHLGVCHGPTSLWLLSEAMEVGTVANLIGSESPPLTWLQTVRLVLDVACGLCYLHGSSPPLVHSHLRSSTVLVSVSLRAKLSTEGLLRQFIEPGAEEGRCDFYQAPELMDGASPQSMSSNVYTFGLLLYEIASRRFIYQEEDGTDTDFFKFTFKTMMGGRPQFADSTPKDYVSMAASCWRAEQHLRPSITTVAEQIRAML